MNHPGLLSLHHFSGAKTTAPAPAPPSETGALLLEDGSYLLLEDGSKLLLG